jgi:hypothetical protein
MNEYEINESKMEELEQLILNKIAWTQIPRSYDVRVLLTQAIQFRNPKVQEMFNHVILGRGNE